MNKEFLIRAGLVIISLLFFSFKTAQLGYSIPDEKRYIQSVKEMVQGGDWITPHYHGNKRFEKPILFYWLGSLSSVVFGISVYAARFPSILFGALSVLTVYLLALELFGRRAGLTSALFLAASGMFYMYSRFAAPEAALVFFTTSAVYFFIKGCKNLEKRKADYFYLFFAMAGLAALTKGPVGPILIIFAASFFTASYGNIRGLIKNMGLAWGVLIFLLISVPWFLAMINIHGDEYIGHIWGIETVGRVASGIDFSSLIKAAFRYILVIITANLMMSAFLPSALIRAAGSKTMDKKGIHFLLGWLISVYLFFVIFGTKKGHYMLPAAVPIALLIGQAFSSKKEDIYKDFLFKIPIFIVTAASLAGVTALLLLMNYMLDTLPRLYYFAMAAPLVLIWGWIKKKDFAAVFIASNIILMLFVMGVARPVLDTNPLQKFAEIIEPALEERDAVGVGSHVISHNRLSQYLDRKVDKVNVEHQNPIEHARENRERLISFLTREEGIFCVVTKEDFLKYVPPGLKERLYILASEPNWKKTNKIKFDRDLLIYFLTGKKDLFIDRVREEILLVSNKGIK